MPTHSQAGREKMWAMHHSTRTSEEVKSLWTGLLQESGECAVPSVAICCWTASDKLFQQLIECHCPVAPWSCSICERANVLLSLTQNEGSLVCLPERNLYGGHTGHVERGHLHSLLQERGRTRRGSSGVSR